MPVPAVAAVVGVAIGAAGAATATTAIVAGTIGAIGLGLSVVGMATKNKTLMKIGQTVGIAGGAASLASFAVAGLQTSAMGATGELAAESAAATTETAASSIADSSISQAAAEVAKSGEASAFAFKGATAAAPAVEGASVASNISTAASPLGPPTAGQALDAVNQGGKFMPLYPGDAGMPAIAQTGSEAVSMLNTGPMPAVNPATSSIFQQGSGLLPTATAPGADGIIPGLKGADLSFGEPSSSIAGSAKVGSQLQPTSMSAPQGVAPSAGPPAAPATPQPLAPSAPPSGPTAPSAPVHGPTQGPSVNPATSSVFQKGAAGGPEGALGWFGKLTPGEKALLVSAGVQGVGTMMGGIYGGINAANQAKLQRWVQQERFKRAGYAPRVSFEPRQGGMINA